MTQSASRSADTSLPPPPDPPTFACATRRGLTGRRTGLDAGSPKAVQPGRPKLAQRVGDGGIASLIAAFAKLPQQPAAGQARIGRDPLAQIRNE